MKATRNDIKKGAVLYYVSCIDGWRADRAKVRCSLEVTSEIRESLHNFGENTSPLIIEYFECNVNYIGLDWQNTDRRYLGDCGMGDGNYNLHRLFTTLESAVAFVEECHTGKFTDARDQDYYDRTITDEYIKRETAFHNELSVQ